MTVKMNKNIKEERYFWIKPIIEKRMRYREVMETCPHSKRSLERQIRLYKNKGINGLIPRNTKPIHSPNKTKEYLRYEVIKLKKKIRVWNNYYNNLEHCGLNGNTPNEMLNLG